MTGGARRYICHGQDGHHRRVVNGLEALCGVALCGDARFGDYKNIGPSLGLPALDPCHKLRVSLVLLRTQHLGVHDGGYNTDMLTMLVD
jgi:hypothetical protein